jgi:hypothetical protein
VVEGNTTGRQVNNTITSSDRRKNRGSYISGKGRTSGRRRRKWRMKRIKKRRRNKLQNRKK